ncbi:MAG: UvrD-helicase domain-containing protein [Deltaproteobacteria bacterium]|jgi:DNA helicase-2/ATP-dependent DNA helicase PcrA|nr:UvrD-helicase domain-containing protein [Deltaproteobacteria bacterium]
MAVDYEKILNPAQYRAVTHPEGPLLIVAGAGTGKTRALVHRVAWLIERGHKPGSILLLTFTRKAAQEMLNRAAELVGPDCGRVAGGTFHSLAHGLLRSKARLLGFSPSFVVMDQDDSEALIGQLRDQSPEIKRFERFPKKGAIANVLSQAVNRSLPLKETLVKHFPHFRQFSQALEAIRQAYVAEKIRRNLLDFDDLLVCLVKLLTENEAARRQIAGLYAHVLVDEYQDTNPAQANLTYLLAKDHQNVTVVGDEAQSIYSFRGASFRNIMEFPKIFPNATIVTLEDNYRSKAPILAVANQIIEAAKEKFDKKLRAVRGDGPLPLAHSILDVTREAELVAQAIKAQLKAGRPLADMAVLFRNAAHSFELEILLQKNKIPFTKHGGRKFLEAAHVKSYLALLRAAINPTDTNSLRRCLLDAPSVGPKTADSVIAWIGGSPEKLASLSSAPLTPRQANSLGPLAQLMSELCRPNLSGQAKVSLAMEYYQALLPDLFPDDHPSRRDDLREIPPMLQGSDLAVALSEIALDPPTAKGQGRSPDGRPLDLTLSTIHSAKGLEWGVVFILSLAEGRFPGSYVSSEENLEEERRLLYVALTRARDELRLMIPRVNSSWEGDPPLPNRFLRALGAVSVESWEDGRKVEKLSWLRGPAQPVNSEPPPHAAFLSPPRNLNASTRGSQTRVAGGRGAGNKPASQPVAPRPPLRGAASQNSSTKASPTPAYDPDYQAAKGHRIHHPVFGAGLVIKRDNDIVTVEFDTYGRKKLVATHARLIRLDR